MSHIAEITSFRTYLVAEIGQNHQGDFSVAQELLTAATEAGVDAVKGQKRDIATLARVAEYQRPYSSPDSFGATYLEHRKHLELTPDQHARLRDQAVGLGIDYFCSVWDCESASQLHARGFDLFKIPSPRLRDINLLRTVAFFGAPVILSTGMSSLADVDNAVRALAPCPLFVLQCTSAYPTEPADINLCVLQSFQRQFGVIVGVSAHYLEIAVDLAAIALGARILERHFTLSRHQRGTDHRISLEPGELRRWVRLVRTGEAALGSDAKKVLPTEAPARDRLAPDLSDTDGPVKRGQG